VLGVHAVIHAEGDQAATQRTSKEADEQTAEVGHVGGGGLGGGVDLRVAVRADHVCGAFGEGHHGGHHGGRGRSDPRLLLNEGLLLRGAGALLGVVGRLGGHPTHRLRVAGGCGGGRGGTEAYGRAWGLLRHDGVC